MKKIFCLLTIFLSLSQFKTQAQQVPQSVLDSLVIIYAKQGMKLEKMYLPDFNRAHPNNMMLYTPCYPGKKISVTTISAKEPGDWYFKVSYGNQVSPKTHTITSLKIDGNTYWTDYILAAFPASFNDLKEECQTVFAYDKNEIDLPVYVLIFSYKE